MLLDRDNDDGFPGDFVPFHAFSLSPDAIAFIKDYLKRLRPTQKLESFAVVVEWADAGRSRNVDGVSWSEHGPGLCLHAVDLFAVPPSAALIVDGVVVGIKIPAGIRQRVQLCAIAVDGWTLPDPADPKSPMPSMGTIGLVLL